MGLCANCGYDAQQEPHWCPRCGRDLHGQNVGVGPGTRPTAPGWYPDPWSATGSGERYFDGRKWGSAERPLARHASAGAGTRGSRRWSRRQALVATGASVALAAAGVVWVGTHHGSTSLSSVTSTAKPTVRKIVPTVGGRTTTTIFGLLGVDYNRGDCVLWDQTPAATQQTYVVPCSKPHLFEIAGRVDLSARFDHLPTDAELDRIYLADCAPQVATLIGRPLDPNGKFAASGIHPSKRGWTRGDHTIWCGAVAHRQSQPPRAYTLTSFRGRIEGADQTLLEPVGSCWASTSRYALPCSAPHQWEVAGYADLTGRVSSPPAETDDAAWQRLVGDPCELVARRYLGHAPTHGFHSSWLTFTRQSWDVGRRTTECTLARFADSTILTETGSAKQ